MATRRAVEVLEEATKLSRAIDNPEKAAEHALTLVSWFIIDIGRIADAVEYLANEQRRAKEMS